MRDLKKVLQEAMDRGSPDPLLSLSSLFGSSSNKKLQSALIATSAAYDVVSSLLDSVEGILEKNTYTVEILEGDPLYFYVMSLVSLKMDKSDRHSVSVSFSSNNMGYDDSYDSPASLCPPNQIAVDFNDTIELKMTMGGHKVIVRSAVSHPPSDDSSEDKSSRKSRSRSRSGGSSQAGPSRKVIIFCKSVESQDAVLSFLEEEAAKFGKIQPGFYSATRWDSFRSVKDIPTRDLNTIVLKEGQLDRVMAYVSNFLSKEQAYVNLGIPWRTGLLLYGPPGTGKTSLATSLAHSLSLPTYFVSLSSIEDDQSLAELFTVIPPRSILLLEDVDIARAVKSRDDDSPRGITMSGLLNVLDGLLSPHGVITILTTNHRDILDPAIIRPGRVDIEEEIGYIDNYQLSKLCETFIGFIPENLPDVSNVKISPADIVGIFKKNLDSPDKNEGDLLNFLDSVITIEEIA